MSSYAKYFFGIKKYGSSAFKRTINHVSTTSSYVSTLWNIYTRKLSKKGIIGKIQGPTWLLASYSFAHVFSAILNFGKSYRSEKWFKIFARTCVRMLRHCSIQRTLNELHTTSRSIVYIFFCAVASASNGFQISTFVCSSRRTQPISFWAGVQVLQWKAFSFPKRGFILVLK